MNIKKHKPMDWRTNLQKYEAMVWGWYGQVQWIGHYAYPTCNGLYCT